MNWNQISFQLISKPKSKSICETLRGVLGSGENGVQKYREQGAWGQKSRKLRERGAEGQILKGAGSGGPPLAEPSVSTYTTLKNGSAKSGKPRLTVLHIGTRYRVDRETIIDKNRGPIRCWYSLCICSCGKGCSPLPALKFCAVVNHDIYLQSLICLSGWPLGVKMYGLLT